MSEYQIKRAVLQRFTINHKFPSTYMAFTDAVALNVSNSADKYAVPFSVLIDTAGETDNSVADAVISKWTKIVDRLSLRATGLCQHCVASFQGDGNLVITDEDNGMPLRATNTLGSNIMTVTATSVNFSRP